MIKQFIIAGLILICGTCITGKAAYFNIPKETNGICLTGNVTYSIVNSIVTNEVDAAVYNKQTNGYTNIEYKMFEYGNYTLGSIVSWNGNGVTRSVTIPDPFAEKVTAKYFVIISKDTYYLHMANLDKREYAVKLTVIKRWKVVTTQKIKMNESTEKVVE